MQSTKPSGSEMIVQGGSFGVVAGGRYDPATDTWTPTNPVNSANNGQGITAVWTGTEMIVWGGLDDDGLFHFDGGRYDPALDIWHPSAPNASTAAISLPSAPRAFTAAQTASKPTPDAFHAQIAGPSSRIYTAAK